MGATGDLEFLSTHDHSGAAGQGSQTPTGLDRITFDDVTAPAAPGASLTRLYAVSGKLRARVGAAGADLEIVVPASPAQGDIIYYNGTNWVRLAAGTLNDFLQTKGAAANPVWAAPPGGWEYDTPITGAASQRVARLLDMRSTDGTNTNLAELGTAGAYSNEATTGLRIHTTANSTATGFVGGLAPHDSSLGMRAAENWEFKILVRQSQAPVGGTVEYWLGPIEDTATGQQDGIGIRSVNAANWFLVCRNAGVETTVDLLVAPGATQQLMEYRISGDGISVQGYVNNVSTGVAITTNIPTNLQRFIAMRVNNRAATVTTSGRLEVQLVGWKHDAAA